MPTEGIKPEVSTDAGSFFFPVDKLIVDLRPEHLGKTYLPLPEPGDSIVVLHEKLQAYATVVRDNESVAAATGFRAATKQEREPEAAARQNMPPQDLEFWDAWKAGRLVLPPVDWSSKLALPPTPASQRGLRAATRRAAALNRLYDTTLATPAHSAWFTSEYPGCLPLLKAMERVIGVERDLVGGIDTLSPLDLAEIQSVSKIIALAASILDGRQEKRHPLLKMIYEDREILLQRLEVARSRVPGRKNRERPGGKGKEKELSGERSKEGEMPGKRKRKRELQD